MKRYSAWATVAIGVYLLCCRWVVGGTTEAVWSAYLTGVPVLLSGGWALALPETGGISAGIGIFAGAWLVASPFVLGFAGSPAAASACVAGALLVAAGEPWRIPLNLVASARVALLEYEAKALSPPEVASARCHEAPECPEHLGRRIVECSTRIRKTLLNHPSEVEVEMCALGYRTCAEEMVKLAGMVAEECPKAGLLRRARLRVAMGMASHFLARAREALPVARRNVRAGGTGKR